MACHPNGYRPEGYIPFFRLFFRDLAAFRRMGHGPLTSFRAALDYWQFDRKAEAEVAEAIGSEVPETDWDMIGLVIILVLGMGLAFGVLITGILAAFAA